MKCLTTTLCALASDRCETQRSRFTRRAVVLAGAVLGAVLLSPGMSNAAAADRIIYGHDTAVKDVATDAEITHILTDGGMAGLEQSPDGARLAMGIQPAPRWEGGLYLSGADGACRTRVPPFNGVGDVSWAPDSVRIAVTTGTLFIVDTGSPTFPRSEVPGTELASTVSWHPSRDEDLLALSSSNHSELDRRDGDILLARPSGVIRTLIGGSHDDRHPAWSRDGARLAFTRADADGVSRIHVAAPDGTGIRPVGADQQGGAYYLRWSRDGRILAADERGVIAVDPDSGATRRLTSSSERYYHQSPDDAPLGTRHGYAVVTGDGSSYGFGASCSAGSGAIAPIAAAANPAAPGHWQVDAAGRVRALAPAQHHRDLTGWPLNQPIVGVTATPSGDGYWLIARDGGVFSFGDATFLGSTGAIRLNQPVVGGASTPSGKGYWLVARDGGIFSFGDAVFHGSTGGIKLNQPIVAMHPTVTGQGYWLVASDGGIFTFGDAAFYGSTGGVKLAQPIVGMATAPDGHGYWLAAADGGVFSFGTARFLGSTGGVRTPRPAVAIVTETIRNGS